MEYIDIHAHIFPANIAAKVVNQLENYYGYRWESSGLCEDLTRSMVRHGVRRAVIFSSATKPEQVEPVNRYLVEQQAGDPEHFYAFGTMHPGYADYKKELASFAARGLHGLKFHPDFQRFYIDAPEMLRIYEAVGDTMPMLFHIGDPQSDYSAPRRLAHVLDLMPHLRVIAAHFGGYSAWDEAEKYLIGRDCWIDTTSSIGKLPPERARDLARKHGIDRVLFGSDYPSILHGHAIGDVLKLGLTPEENEKIFHLNAEKLLHLPPVQP